MPWNVPTPPASPLGAPAVTVVKDAYLTTVARGPIGSPSPPKRWFRGAVYDTNNRLVGSSQKLGGVNGYNWAPADTGKIPARLSDVETLRGTWLYGGHWIQHFGHFAIETITALWPEVEPVGLVFHKYLKRPWSVEPWQARFIDLCGYGNRQIRVVESSGPLAVEELIVPGRSVVSHGWAHREAVQVWDRVAAPFLAASTGPIYLSRTGHNHKQRAAGHRSAFRSSDDRDRELDRLFEGAGFNVVRPEELSLDNQLSLVANASTIAGLSGSALHLSAFAQTARVLEIGDNRSPGRPMPMQLVIDSARNHEHQFIRGDLSMKALSVQLDRLGTDW